MGNFERESASVQATTVTDIGERIWLLGDPLDASVLWVKKVTGSGTGGRPVPEMVLDDEFVSVRLNLEFPNGEDGEPVITIGVEVLDVMNGLWKQCMIVRVLGRTILISAMSRKLREM